MQPMQQVTRKKLGAGVNLTCVTTPRFKRAVLRVGLLLPLGGPVPVKAKANGGGFGPSRQTAMTMRLSSKPAAKGGFPASVKSSALTMPVSLAVPMVDVSRRLLAPKSRLIE